MSATINVELGAFGTYPALVGLDWDCVPAGEWQKQKKRLGNKSVVTQFSIKSHLGKEICFGTTDEIDRSDLKHARIALAATIAESLPDGRHSIVEKFETEKGETVFWFVALTEGRIVYGTDIVGNESQITEELHTHLSMADADDQGEQVHGSASMLARGLVPDSQIQEAPISDLMSRDILKRSQLSPGVAARLKDLSPKTMAVIAVALLSGVWLLIQWWPDSEPQVSTQSGEERRAALTEQARQALAETLNAMTDKTALETVAWIASGVAGKLPIQVGQWEIKSTLCNSDSCNTTYINNGNTLPEILRSAVGEACVITFTASAKEAICQQDVKGLQIQKDRYVSLVAPNAMRDRVRDHLMKVVEAGGSESAYGLSGFSSVSFDNSQMIAGEKIPDKNTFQVEIPLTELDVLAQSPLHGQAPIAIDRFEIDWQSQQAKASGFFYGEITQ